MEYLFQKSSPYALGLCLTKFATSVDCGYAATLNTLPVLPFRPHNELPNAKTSSTKPSEQYLSPAFLTQRYRSQLHPSLLETYRNLSLVVSLLERALEPTLASKDVDTLTQEEAALYDVLRLPTLHKLVTSLVDEDEESDARATEPMWRNFDPTPIQSICRVIIPFIALQDEFIPFRRAAYTATFMNCLYDTLSSEINLETCWATWAEVMLWATLFGVYLSRGIMREKELWFSKLLVKGVRARKGQKGQLGGTWKWEWSAIRDVLKRFYWSEKFFGEEFKVSLFQVSLDQWTGGDWCPQDMITEG